MQPSAIVRVPTWIAAILAISWSVAFAVAQVEVPVTLDVSPVNGVPSVALSNGCVRAVLDLSRGALTQVFGRFECDGDFSASPNVAPTLATTGGRPANTPAEGITAGAVAVIVTGDGRGHKETSTSAVTRTQPLSPTIIDNRPEFAAYSVVMEDMTNDPAYAGPRVSAVFTFSLAQNDRALGVNVTVRTLTSFNATAVRVSTAWCPADAVTMYATGVRQGFRMMHGSYVASTVTPLRFYSLGLCGAVDVTPVLPISQQTVMFAGDFNGRRSGFDVVVAGAVINDAWIDGFENSGFVNIAAGGSYSVALLIAPNQYDFPLGLLPVNVPTLPVDDLRAILTAVYGSPVSALHSYDYSPETRIMPCINVDGNVCYGPMANFFDPDTFISISAMMLSFDPAVHAAARGLLETNARFFCTGVNPNVSCEFAQMMHHFVPSCDAGDRSCVCTTNPQNPAITDCVTYQAISGAVQTGPNIFWTWGALRYVAMSGDYAWLTIYLPAIRNSMRFLLNRYDTNVGLFNVPGSLFIDTFIRANYTADTNAAMVLLLELVADAELFVGNSTGGDHYCTQSDPVPGHPGSVAICTRDFVDYDANLFAVAAGVATGSLAQRILGRVDSGACTHSRATYVSEIYYNAQNCNVNNTGDSAITMGRIGWADALARRAVGDAANADVFFNLILNPLQNELLANTFLYERYTCQGTPTHNPYYIEMPEVVAMLLAEAKYGVKFGFNNFTVHPVQGVDAFDWNMGPVGAIGYSHTQFKAMLAFAGSKIFVVGAMQPGTYSVVTSAGGLRAPAFSVVVGADGMLVFAASTGPGSSAIATLQ